MNHALSTKAKPPVRRREATDQRRREILDAALKLFLRQGIPATTMPQICTESGASTGSVYHLFGGKDEIAMTLFVEGMLNYEKKMLHSIESKKTLRDCIRALIATHLQHIVDNPPLSMYLARLGIAEDQGEISEQYRKLNNHFSQTIWSHLKPFVERGEMIRLSRELYFSLSDLVSATEPLAEAAWKSLRT
jgi:AcrR family transcriptional regulator